MDVKFKLINDVLYIMLIGELDDYSASYTRSVIDEALQENNFGSVVFELSHLEFMDSTGIGVLIGRYKNLKNKNKPIYISNPTQTVEKIFKMSGIFEIMPKIS